MSLRRRTLLSVGLTIITLTLVLYAFSRTIVLQGFADLESQSVSQTVARVLNALSVDLSTLDTLTYDWSAWDNTYAFVEDLNPAYIAANLTPGTFAGLRLNFIAYVDSQGQLVYSQGYDLATGAEIPLPASFLPYLTGVGVLVLHDAESARCGVVMLPEGPLEECASPILTSEGAGPLRGTLVMARYLDASQLAALRRMALTTFTLSPYTEAPSALQQSLSTDSPVLVTPISADTVMGYGLWYDVYDEPALVVQVEAPRDIYRQGQRSMLYLLFSSLAVAVIFGALTFWLLEKSVLARLSYLSRTVESIGDERNLSGRVFLSGDDELASLANAINRMLVIIQLAQVERDQNAEALWQYNEALSQLNQLGQRLVATLSQEQIAFELSRAASKITGAQSVSVWLADPDGSLVCWASTDAAGEGDNCSLLNLRLTPGQGVAGWVLRHGESVFINDTSADERFFSGVDEQIGFQSKNMLAVPLQMQGRNMGVLELVNKLQEQFTPEDLSLAETLAASVAIAIENARLVERLQCYMEDLQAQNAELDAFAHTVAHDLKSPLSVLVGFAGLLKSQAREMSVEEIVYAMQRIEQGAYKANNIINELLLLASVRKMEEVHAVPLDMGAIVSEAVTRLLELIAQSDGELHAPDVWPRALGHAAWVEEVWVNYISNAFKYGGHPPVVTLGADVLDGGFIRYWVHDNGQGLTAEEQSRLFAPFERLDQTRVRGHGLGLSIIQRIASKLGGKVGVESAMGEGSTFWFTLPTVESNGVQ